MALTATFTADMSGFKKAMDQGIVSVQAFNKATAESITNVQRQVNRFSGVQLISDAQKMAEAVRRLGGDSGTAAGLLKLLPAELERVRAAMDQATQKAKLMGVALPDALKGINAELAKLPPATSAVGGAFGSLGGIIGKLGPLLPVSTIAGAATALIGMGKAALDTAGRVADLAQKTGLSTKSIQIFEAVAAESGTTVEAFSSAAFKLGVNLETGSKGAEKAIRELGLSLSDLQSMSKDAQLDTVLRALDSMDDATKRNALGVQLFGRQFAEIAAGVSGDYGKMADAAVVMSDRQVQALDRAGDALARFFTRLKNEVGAALGNIALLADGIGNLLEGSATKFGSSLENLTAEQAQLIAFTKKSGGDVAAVLRQIQEQQAKASELGPMFGPPEIKSAKDYAAELKAVQAELAALTPAQRAQIDAANKLGEETDVLASRFGLSEAALKLYESAAKSSTKTTDEFARSMKELTGVTALDNAAEAVKKLAAAGGPLKVTSEGLKALAKTFDDAAKAAISLGKVDLAEQYALMARTLQPVVQFQQRWNVTIGEYVTDANLAAAATDALADQVNRLTGEVITLLPPLKSTLDVWKSFEQFKAPAIEVPSTGPITDSIGATMRQELADIWKDIPMTLARAFEGGGDWLGAFKSLGSQIGTVLGKGIGEGIGEVGGLLGKIFGPIGAALGSLVGPLIGKIGDALTVSAGEDVMKRVGKHWGVQISEALADQIAETAKTLFKGDRLTAEVFHFADIVKAAGGLNELNFDRFLSKFRDVFVLFGQGKLSLQQTQQVLNDNFRTFADVIVKSGNIATKEFLELIRLNKELGTESTAILEFVTEQATRAGSALAGAFAGAVHPEEFQRLGVLALGAFNAAIESGLSMQEALRAVGPSLDQLVDGFARLGIEADAALQPLLVAHQVAKSTAGQAAAALNEAVLALSNFGALNEQTLDALEGQLGTIFQRVQAEVAAVGGSHADALRQIVPFLQQAMRAAEEFGLTLDPATRELIDQARELGLLGQKGESETDKMTEGFESVVEAVHELTDAILGIPRAAREAANALADIKLPDLNRQRPGDGGTGEYVPPDLGPSSVNARSVVGATATAHAITLAPVIVYGSASAAEIDRALAGQLPTYLATGQPRAAVTALATFAAEEAIARAR